MDGTDLSSATLLRVHSGGITGTPLLPAGYILRGGWLIGPSVSFRDSVPTGLDLTGTDVTGVEFSGADLTGVPGPGNGTAANADYSSTTTCADGTPAPYLETAEGWGYYSCAGIGDGW